MPASACGKVASDLGTGAGFRQVLQFTSPITTGLTILVISLEKNKFSEIFEGGMLINTQHTILLQIFCEFVINYKVIYESIEGTDNTCQKDVQAWKG